MFKCVADAIADGLINLKFRIMALQYDNMGVSGREKATHKEWWPYRLNLTANPSDYIIHSPGLDGTDRTVSFESLDFPGYYIGLGVSQGEGKLFSGKDPSSVEKATFKLFKSPLDGHYTIEFAAWPGRTLVLQHDNLVMKYFDGVNVQDYLLRSTVRFVGKLM